MQGNEVFVRYLFIFLFINRSIHLYASQDIMEVNRRSHWQGYVREFRSEHNFSVAMGMAKSKWLIKPSSWTDDIRPTTKAFYAKVQYSFHIPFWRGFGYFLGSSFGSIIDNGREVDGFKPTSVFMLPGILGGFIANISANLRLGLAVDSYLERVDGISWLDEGHSTQLSINMMALLDSMAFVDIFYNLNWAFRMEYHLRNVSYTKPESQFKDKVVDAKINRMDSWIGLGLVYHLL